MSLVYLKEIKMIFYYCWVDMLIILKLLYRKLFRVDEGKEKMTPLAKKSLDIQALHRIC